MKKDLIKKGFYFFVLPIYAPLLIPWLLTDQRLLILEDLGRWLKISGGGEPLRTPFCWLAYATGFAEQSTFIV
jgi:hypothetical protein